MPSRNAIKEYQENGIYHIYNRGINKQSIFLNGQDYSTFLFYLKLYLEDPENLKDIDPQKRRSLIRKNFHGSIDLLSYCLMPNHFHLLIKQKNPRDITGFMKSITTNYSMYFNDKHKRSGTLFQGRYKAVLVKSDEYLLHLSRYIHLNPKELIKGQSLDKLWEYQYSSFPDYIDKRNTTWIRTSPILEYFAKNKNSLSVKKNTYKDFIEDNLAGSKEILGSLTLE